MKQEVIEGMRAELYRLANSRYVAALKVAQVQLGRSLAKAGIDLNKLDSAEDLGANGVRLFFAEPEPAPPAAPKVDPPAPKVESGGTAPKAEAPAKAKPKSKAAKSKATKSKATKKKTTRRSRK